MSERKKEMGLVDLVSRSSKFNLRWKKSWKWGGKVCKSWKLWKSWKLGLNNFLKVAPLFQSGTSGGGWRWRGGEGKPQIGRSALFYFSGHNQKWGEPTDQKCRLGINLLLTLLGKLVGKHDWFRICSVMIKSWKFSIFIIAIFANGTLLLPDPVFWLIDPCCFPIWISEVSFLLTDFQFSILSFHFRTSAYYPAYLIFDLESGAMLDSEPRKKHLQGTHTHTAQHTIPHTFTLILSQREHLCHVKFWMQIIKISK